MLEWKETARSLDTGPKSYVGTIQSFYIFYHIMAEGLHRSKNGICKIGINLQPGKDVRLEPGVVNRTKPN